MTQEQALIKALEARGEQRVPTRASNYVVYTRKFPIAAAQQDTKPVPLDYSSYYIVTRGGALRVNTTPTRTGSLQVGSALKAILLAEGGYR